MTLSPQRMIFVPQGDILQCLKSIIEMRDSLISVLCIILAWSNIQSIFRKYLTPWLHSPGIRKTCGFWINYDSNFMVIFSKSKLDFGIWEIFYPILACKNVRLGWFNKKIWIYLFYIFTWKWTFLKIFHVTVWCFKQETSLNNNFII